MNIILFALICGALGVVYALVTAAWVSKQDAGPNVCRISRMRSRKGPMPFWPGI